LRTLTFVSPSGNVCLLTVKGFRARLGVIDAAWDHSPSKKDQRRLREWFDKEYASEFGTPHFFPIHSAEAREAIYDQILWGGGRN
jgi:hypothetical protein